jgi:hypothetical protein
MNPFYSMIRSCSLVFFCLLPATAIAGVAPGPATALEFFSGNPLLDAETVLEGAAFDRVQWLDDAPAFPGDAPGSLVANYDALAAPARVGLRLEAPFTEADPFVAGMLFSIDSDGFEADPFGFFQISWGLWNTGQTGFERTGNFEYFAADTFELVEFDYFPNVSPWFGGPFITPSLFGAADPENPLFDFLGAFANGAFGSREAALPFDRPLLAILEHRPDEGLLISYVFEQGEAGEWVLMEDAIAAAPLGFLSKREFLVDAIGLTLWKDGFSGPTPSVRATVHVQAIGAVAGNFILEGIDRELLRD